MGRSMWVLLSALIAAPWVQAADVDGVQNYSMLIISRERLEIGTPCQIGIFLNGNQLGLLSQEESASFNLAPGKASIRLRTLPDQAGYCKPGIEASNVTDIVLQAGAIQRYRIATGQQGYYLKPEPLSNLPGY